MNELTICKIQPNGKLKKKKKELEAEMTKPAVYGNPDLLFEATQKYDKVKSELEQAMKIGRRRQWSWRDWVDFLCCTTARNIPPCVVCRCRFSMLFQYLFFSSVILFMRNGK